VYAVAVHALKAHVVKGKIVVDESVDLPDGAELHLYLHDPADDSLDDEERAELHRSIERGIAQADAGDLIDADEVLAELESSP
jgi:hypothetical protein